MKSDRVACHGTVGYNNAGLYRAAGLANCVVLSRPYPYGGGRDLMSEEHSKICC